VRLSRLKGASAGQLSSAAATLVVAFLLVFDAASGRAVAQIAAPVPGLAIKSRHLEAARDDANKKPRSEGDQVLKDGWPLYRSARAQAAFNDAMATMQATAGSPPAAERFAACAALACPLAMPKIGADGWIPPGRLWVSPAEYVLFVKSPRLQDGQRYNRRSTMAMRYFVFHEFHNSTRNTDVYDTIASHRSAVFVPFYMSKPGTDAAGRRFVVVVQVAPYDVVSIHATNMGSTGPGIEVARNVTDAIEPLQNIAGILTALTVKEAAPRLQIVNHRGTEGLAMRQAFERRANALRSSGGKPVTLPFTPAAQERLMTASAQLGALLQRKGGSAPLTLTERAIVPTKSTKPELTPGAAIVARADAEASPVLVGAIQRAVRIRADSGDEAPRLLQEPVLAWRRPQGHAGTR
jgi:hypothetical protein